MKRSKFLQALGLIAIAPVAIAKAVEGKTVVKPIVESSNLKKGILFPNHISTNVSFLSAKYRRSPTQIIDLYNQRGVVLVDETYTDFQDGFEEGYCEGYKFVKGQYVTCPVAPVAPVPQVGQDNYKGGYNAGFVKGREKASE